MFENRSRTERTVIYAVIAFIVTLILALFHYFIQGWILIAVITVFIIEYVCIFYILYLPLKFKREQ